MKKNLILAVTLTLSVFFSGNYLQAQTKEDAAKAFNEALEISKTDMTAAVTKMQEVLKMSNALGADADSIKMNIAKVLPVWQFNIGNNFLRDKAYDKAIPAFEQSLAFATTYSDNNIKEKSVSQLLKLYLNEANTMLKGDKPDEALAFADKALTFDPEYSKAFFTKGQVYKKKGDDAKMKENMDMAIASATKTNDTIIVKAAKSAIGVNMYNNGKEAFQKKNYTEAVNQLNGALSYDYKNNKELYYLLAASNNNLKKFDEAIIAANAGLPLEEQTDVKTARFYYEIAKAFEGKKDNANACSNYRKAAFGTFAQSANYQIKTVLKCN